MVLMPLFVALANPFVLLGVAIFAIVMILMLYFMLGKIIGVIIILAGLFSLKWFKWYVALIFILLGVLIFINPFEWARLQMMW